MRRSAYFAWAWYLAGGAAICIGCMQYPMAGLYAAGSGIVLSVGFSRERRELEREYAAPRARVHRERIR